MNKLNRFYLSQNISIDNALSMNQILHQIVNQIKEIVDFINNLELRANEYTDQEILKLKNNLEEQIQTLEITLKTYTDDSISTYNVDVINPQLNEIRNTIDNVNQLLNNRIDREVGILNRRVDSEVSTLNRIIEDTKTYLEDLIKKGMAYVYSSISGLHLPLQNVLGEIGNVLKQTLSYNWNSIDEFKNYSYGFFKNLSNYNIVVQPTLPIIYTKGIKHSEVPTEDNHQYVYIEYDCTSVFDTLNIGDTLSGGYGYSNSVDVYTNGGGPLYIEKVANNKVRIDISQITTAGYSNYEYYSIGIADPNYHNYFDDLSKVNMYYGDYGTTHITFNSIKTAMEYLNVNYNSLAYIGVNTFYELNETEKLFDTEGIKSDYFTGNKYKVIHNNFDSDFFAYEEEENNENEGE